LTTLRASLYFNRAMLHAAMGKPKIVRDKCTLPLSSVRLVDTVVTEMALLKSLDQRLLLNEVAPGISIDDVVQNTEAELIIPAEIPEMCIAA
jgi:acetate CoA/acetoacetate CoA-transferase beta subunit